MTRFASPKKKRGLLRSILTTVLLFGCCMGFFLHGISGLSASTEETYTARLRHSILRRAGHCYAMEGRYPESLAYLKEHYAISWDETQYVVDYEITGSNLRPDVTVIPLNRKEDAR